jgi:hypothetical protein
LQRHILQSARVPSIVETDFEDAKAADFTHNSQQFDRANLDVRGWKQAVWMFVTDSF